MPPQYDWPFCTLEPEWFDDDLPLSRDNFDAADILGMEHIPDITLVHLCGAPRNATVDMYSDGQALIFEVTHSSLIPTRNHIEVRLSPDRQFYVYLKQIHYGANAPDGIGAATLCRIVRACLALGIGSIHAYALGGRKTATPKGMQRFLGYYAWPRYGFDGAFGGQDDEPLIGHYPYLPAGVADGSVRSLHQLLDREGGVQFWFVNGTARNVRFEVAAGSLSMLRLDKYLTDKGIRDYGF